MGSNIRQLAHHTKEKTLPTVYSHLAALCLSLDCHAEDLGLLAKKNPYR